ncbi:Scr1 family TA system antitoxin-like transcriptional regulator [Glycomyces xiaoerkulensis]|uniref:Scr1 family TA system antitoxin-like transcriptional regulator n=1 Tax=Glycomyces xiaoerkulensis TaxID=2038139 RepID=UPI0012FFEEB5|nr:Scr1 family TA system antitoxin-like transcriptional regulator [Glycomyces xiaoerkulensis]
MKYPELSEWHVRAELIAIRDEANVSQKWIGEAIKKHQNTVGGWERGDRLPDPGNVALICLKLGVDKERAAFLLHVIEQLHEGPGVISDLEKRNLFIVEGSERRYGRILTWDPLLLHGLLQKEPYHMKLLAEPLEGGPAQKIKSWKRKERRIEHFFSRTDHPEARFLIPAQAIAELSRLTEPEKEHQVQRLLEVDAMPKCEVRVVDAPHEALHAFNIFHPDGRSDAGPPFVYVEAIDQSRHIVEDKKLALYDRIAGALWENAIPIGRFLHG